MGLILTLALRAFQLNSIPVTVHPQPHQLCMPWAWAWVLAMWRPFMLVPMDAEEKFNFYVSKWLPSGLTSLGSKKLAALRFAVQLTTFIAWVEVQTEGIGVSSFGRIWINQLALLAIHQSIWPPKTSRSCTDLQGCWLSRLTVPHGMLA